MNIRYFAIVTLNLLPAIQEAGYVTCHPIRRKEILSNWAAGDARRMEEREKTHAGESSNKQAAQREATRLPCCPPAMLPARWVAAHDPPWPGQPTDHGGLLSVKGGGGWRGRWIVCRSFKIRKHQPPLVYTLYTFIVWNYYNGTRNAKFLWRRSIF